jgi:hypothetical protein
MLMPIDGTPIPAPMLVTDVPAFSPCPPRLAGPG